LNDAKSDGEKCVALEPSFVKGYHRKANAEFLLGELEAAEATIRAGLKKDPNMTELKRLLQKVGVGVVLSYIYGQRKKSSRVF
jgi:hypothetical protein